ncbi:hypothetical protein [Pelagibacterium xiamenense]|uniref:hypothetical protein n=1 Tax=Pelagibacterium xiamenense TaxID=2901140 RepID=UPI001E5EA0EA|nr:hypothetical protein [Pelagibacterium xiamenense]MCD7059310.1 hypothetical protein [Pelagibacterium xiamenense]
MTKPIVISVHGEPQGVVVPGDGDFRFMAVKLGVFPLEGKVFESVAAAQQAARALVDGAGEFGETFTDTPDDTNGLVA